MLSVFLAGFWRETVFGFLRVVFRSFRQIGWAELWDGSG